MYQKLKSLIIFSSVCVCSLISFSDSCLGFNDVWDERKQVHTCSTRPDSLDFIDQHHAGAVLLDEPNPSEV